ncbi:PROLINE-RICH RECEPTOR-LIKE PROTEIN KINASE PERK4 [Salix purpurea]|uniref:non-specific serine/threonine protein kinase n=1 Tax=Salix purpurea TaxID=77065 RepID=A0A9Q0YVI7_SALPP|nr:PROLINE-RICH RECEPTOR-LIKE PROTEIN KINASE PERK4 [Salix purpurea]
MSSPPPLNDPTSPPPLNDPTSPPPLYDPTSPPPLNDPTSPPPLYGPTSPPPLYGPTSPPPLYGPTSPPPLYGPMSPPPLYDPTSPPPPSGFPGPAGPSPPVLSALIVGVVLCVLAGLGISVCVYRRKKRKEAQTLLQPGIFAEHPSTISSMGSDKQHPPPTPGIALGYSQSTFTYEELAKATDNFSKANLLGQGGFGYVHKGVLANGTVVAIKQLKSGSRQGEREFQAEIEIISRIHHRHLVSLFGYCITGAQRMLVYEFVPNNTLEFHLHENGRRTMNWLTTMRIAVGAAKGLAYLHEDCQPKIIHRDIKASNILIDNSFEAKVADFGLAKYSLDTETHVSTRVMGTFGYMAPEYASSGKLTAKSDVYSFGVVLLELISGRRPVDRTQSCIDDSIVDWARPLLKQALEDGNLDAVVDPKLQDYDFNEMTQMIRCAAACVRRSGRFRPRMSQIVLALKGNMPLDELNEGITSGSSDYNTGQYMDDLKKFRKLALESPEHDNSTVNPLASTSSQECSEPTSESGRNTFSSCSEGQQTIPEMNSTN